MTNDEQRREPRYVCRLPAVLRRGKRSIDVATENVSSGGLFVRMSPPPGVRELVEIEIALPPDDRRVRLHGMVVHTLLRGRDAERAPGMGVELRGVSGDSQSAWEAFIRSLSKK